MTCVRMLIVYSFFNAVVAGLACLAGGCSANIPDIKSLTELQQMIATSDRPVLVEYYKEACEHCNAFEATLRELADENKGRVTIVKFLLLRADGRSTAEEFATKNDILVYPTVVFYVNGVETKRFVQNYYYTAYESAIAESLRTPTTRPNGVNDK